MTDSNDEVPQPGEAGFAALLLSQTMFVYLVQSGLLPKPTARELLDTAQLGLAKRYAKVPTGTKERVTKLLEVLKEHVSE